MDIHDMPGHLIRRIHQHATHVFQQRVRAAGLDLTPVQFAALSAIRDTPGIDQATVAAQIGYDRATIGGVIDRLERKRWITREISKTDKRARAVALAEDGHAVLAAAAPVVRALQGDILGGLSTDEAETVTRLLRKSLDSL